MAQVDLPHFAVRWIKSLLHGRLQRLRIGSHSPDWLPVRGEVPLGTRIGPAAFIFMINDLMSDRPTPASWVTVTMHCVGEQWNSWDHLTNAIHSARSRLKGGLLHANDRHGP